MYLSPSKISWILGPRCNFGSCGLVILMYAVIRQGQVGLNMRLMLMQKAGRLLNMHPGNAVCQSQVDSYNQLAGRAAVLFSFNLGKRGATKWSDGFMSPQAFLNSWTQVQFWLLWASDSHVISKLRTKKMVLLYLHTPKLFTTVSSIFTCLYWLFLLLCLMFAPNFNH